MKVLVKTILSFMLTSWTYSETMLIFPEIKPLTEKVIQTLKIPTHDNWRVYYDLEYREDVQTEINKFLVSTGLDSDSNQFANLKILLSAPSNMSTHGLGTNYVSMFDNSGLTESLFERF